MELIWLEQFMAVLPSAAQNWVMCNTPQTLEEAVQVTESYEAASRLSSGGSAQTGEIWKGGRHPKMGPGEADAPSPLTPSGQGRRMDGKSASEGGETRSGTQWPLTPMAPRHLEEDPGQERALFPGSGGKASNVSDVVQKGICATTAPPSLPPERLRGPSRRYWHQELYL